MSLNNEIIINRKTFVVYYHACADNEFIPEEAEIIGKGKNLEEAVDMAVKFQKQVEVEYGITFI